VSFRLPDPPHVPGSGTVPDRALLEPLKAPCPALVRDDNWRDAYPFRAGLELYAGGCFWEAHEVWEPVWLATPPNSRERQLLAGLIQLANAGLKLRMRQSVAARRLVDLAAGHIAEASAGDRRPLMGVGLADLQAGIVRWRAAIDDQPGQAGLNCCLLARPRIVIATLEGKVGHLR